MKTPILSYKSLIQNKLWEYDKDQDELVNYIEILHQQIIKFQVSRDKFINKIFRKPIKPPLGLYIYGSVGRGKSVMMDMFSNTNQINQIKRVHFHAFMHEAHKRIRKQRNISNSGDPIIFVAKAIFSETKVLCFDEFQVNDAADAMILKRLFEKLFQMGLVIISTSNQHPDELYKGGINRELFLPFIALIKKRCRVFEIKGERDFRLEKLVTNKVYFSPINTQNKLSFNSLFKKISGSENYEKIIINVESRDINIEKYSNGIGVMSFNSLCNQPLGSHEYLAIAKTFKTFFISDIPKIKEEEFNQAKRFINLIDVLYDNKINVVFLADSEPENLYKGKAYISEFNRTSSRLHEMQSEQYLKQLSR